MAHSKNVRDSKIMALWSAYEVALHTSPIKTKALTSGVISAFSDVVAQKMLEKREKLDYRRLLNFFFIGLIISPICHYWYSFLEILFQGNTSRLANILRLITDQLLFDPFLTITFFFLNAILNKKPFREATEEIRAKFWDSQIMSWRVWPAVQYVNFNYIPEKFRVLFANLAGFFWGIYMAYKASTPKKGGRVTQ